MISGSLSSLSSLKIKISVKLIHTMSTFTTLLSPAMSLDQQKQMSVQSTRRVAVIPESGASYSLTGTGFQDIFFSLPSGNKYEMVNGANSYLMFDLVPTNTGGTTAAFCGGDASSIIRLLEVTQNGLVTEQLDRYNVMSGVFQDFLDVSQTTSLSQILGGGCSAAKVGVTQASGTGFFKCCVKIYSTTYGCLASTYAPSISGSRIRIQLEAPNTALQGDASTTNLAYALSNVQLMMEYVSIEPSVWEELANSAGRVFKVPGIGVSTYSSTLVAQTTSNNVLIPARKSAVKHVWNVFRPSANITDTLENSTSGRVFPNLRQWYFTINGRSYPNLPVRTSNSAATLFSGAESMAEFLKTMRNLNSPLATCCFTHAQYLDNSGEADTASYVQGLDFETDDDPLSISGISTMSENIFLQLDSATTSVGAPTASIGIPVALTLDSFVFYDQIMTVNVDTGAVQIIQ